MKTFSIFGDIVAQEEDKNSFEDLTPTQFEAFLKNLEPREPLLLEINSLGGDVYAGLAICSLIRKAVDEGHEVTARVMGIAASIASVICCACSRIELPENSFFMMHLPWCSTSGNAIDLAKDIEQLNRCKQAIISAYKSKFFLTENEIEEMMTAETWILGRLAHEYHLNAEIIPAENELKIAAKLTEKGYKNMPKDLIKEPIKVETKDEMKPENERLDNEIVTPVVDCAGKTDEKTEPGKEMIPLDEAEKRVSGMQSKMQEQINNLKRDFAEKIAAMETDFNNSVLDRVNELKAKEEELTSARNEVTSLKDKLESVTKELSETVSALDAKKKALDTLNSNVNTPANELPTMQNGLAKCANPKERVAFLMSGNYIK